MADDQAQPINSMNEAGKNTISQAMILKNYCTSVLRQPEVDFSREPELKEVEVLANQALATAKKHAKKYIVEIFPDIHKGLHDMQEMLQDDKNFTAILATDAKLDDFIAVFSYLQSMSEKFAKDAKRRADTLNELAVELNNDSAEFEKVLSNPKVQEILARLEGKVQEYADQIKVIKQQISVLNKEAAAAAIRVKGAIAMLVVGTIASFFCCLGLGLVIGGAVVLAKGIKQEKADYAQIAELTKQQNELMVKSEEVHSELTMIHAFVDAFKTFGEEAAEAAKAAGEMATAWNDLNDHFGKLVDELQVTQDNPVEYLLDSIKQGFMKNIQDALQNVLDDINTIDDQLTGVSQDNVPEGTTLSDAVQVQAAKPLGGA